MFFRTLLYSQESLANGFLLNKMCPIRFNHKKATKGLRINNYLDFSKKDRCQSVATICEQVVFIKHINHSSLTNLNNNLCS